MKHYVVGFCFDPTLRGVVLVKKERPAWQRGKWNGVGGSVEDGETYLAAVEREFREEAGLTITGWRLYLSLYTKGNLVHFFYAVSDEYAAVTTKTDEQIGVFPVETILTPGTEQAQFLPNIPWHVSMALAIAQGREHCIQFHVYEVETRG